MPISKQLTGNFEQDVLDSQNGAESEVKQLILNNLSGTVIKIPTTEIPDFDFSFLWFGKELKVEVKEDFRCKETGNVAVEIRKGKRKTGVFGSKSDWIIYKIHEPDGNTSFVLYSTAMLKHRCLIGDHNGRVTGGRNDKQTCCLFELSDFKEKGIVLSERKCNQ